jgi:membrane-bound serine protease (ClpP class)
MRYFNILRNTLLLFFLFQAGITLAQNKNDSTTRVFVMELRAGIDPRTNRYTEIALEEAREQKADLIIVDMNTYGGAVNDADDIRTRFLEFEKPIYTFINKNAASAGALISIATDSIYMATGASIGAATVVTQDGAAAPDKYQSYMRSIMRSTAEATGRDPKIAEAMVDETIEIEGITAEGEVITFSTSEAIEHGFAEAQMDSIEELLQYAGVEDYEIIDYELSVSEKIISFFINPIVSGILIMLILGGIYFELQTPGIGFPILASVIALILYLVPYYLNGLAANWEIIAFFVGLVLIGLELFVIPGFGIAGISGIMLSLGSLVLIMINNEGFNFDFVPFEQVVVAISTALGGLLAGVIMMFLGGARLMNSNVFKRVSLEDVQDRLQGYTSNFQTTSFMGKTGVTFTVLRPSGKVMIDGEIYDAYTRGDYIEKDTKVKVVEESGTSLKVRKVEE